jgi:dolichol-phosphate mannosyltransferase
MAAIESYVPTITEHAPARVEGDSRPWRGTLPVLFVIPAYNEVANIPRLLADLEERRWLLSDGSRVIVVDDGSTDGTAEAVRAYAGPLPVELLELGVNQGPGAAFRAGFASALRDLDEAPSTDALIVTLEADTTSDLDALPTMLSLAEGGVDLVLASVHGEGGRMVNVSLVRRVLSSGAGTTTRRALRVNAATVSSFFRVYRASLLQRATRAHGDALIREAGYACKAELLAKLTALDARIEEVPVELDATRRIGASKMRVLPTMLGYARLVVRQRCAGKTRLL